MASRRQRGASPFVEHLRRVAAGDPERVAFRFLADGESESDRLTFAALDRRARAIAATLREAGPGPEEPGGRALLLFPPGLDFVAAFLGCLYAGTVAVPVPPPRFNRPQPRLSSVVRDARPAAVLTVGSIAERRERLARHVPELAGARFVTVDALEDPDARAAAWRAPERTGPGDLAFLQYTSGSTSLPKGVRVTHANLLHNEEMIRRAFGQDRDSVIVSWLPLFHDMGLIGGVLQPLFLGARCVLMSPMAFLQRPVRWLRAIGEHRATTSGGPDFAYALCARRVPAEERADLDLSSWRVAFDGAEPVRAATLDAFAEAFAPCGFDRRALFPCYGLAEATLFVTGNPAGSGPVTRTVDAAALERGEVEAADGEGGERSRALVSSGRAWSEQEVAIVDPESRRPLPAGRVGEIWVAGPSVADGYWERPEATARDFGARRADGGGPYLRTGDLGFLDPERPEQLFVTGRLVDLIILRGRNLYPQDVELAAEAVSGDLRAGASAAFSVPAEGEERLVVVAELEPRAAADEDGAAATAEEVRRAVGREHEAAVHEVVLVARGEVPRTSSGKVRRSACRERYLAGTLKVVARAGRGAAPEPAAAGEPEDLRQALKEAPSADRPALVAALLRDLLARALGVAPESVDDDSPLTALGLDSLGAVELQHAVEERLGVGLSLADLLEDATLTSLAAALTRIAATPAEADRIDRVESPEPKGPETGSFPASAGQRALWFLQRLDPDSAAYNLVGAAHAPDSKGSLDPEALRRACAALARRHPALRTTFDGAGGEPRQVVRPELAADAAEEDARGWEAGRLAARLEEEAYRPFDLAAGPLWRLRLFREAEGWTVLFVIHHAVADFWSLGVLARELGALYDRESGRPAHLPGPPALRYTDFTRWQEERLAGPEGERLLAFWRRTLAGGNPGLDLPTDRPRPPRAGWRGGAVPLRVEPEGAAALRRLARRSGTTLFTVLLAGFRSLLYRTTGRERAWIGSPTSGRAGGAAHGLGDLIGYFVNPVVLAGDLTGRPSFADAVERERRGALDAFQHQELPLSMLAERLGADDDAGEGDAATREGRSPLYQAMLVLQRTARPAERALAALALGRVGAPIPLGDLELESVAVPERTAQLDLTVTLAELGGAIEGRLQYDADLFDPVTARRMADRFARLLAAAAADPEARVDDLPLLSAAERAQVLTEWSQGTPALDPEGPGEDACLHELVAARARIAPEAPALTWLGAGGRAETWSHGRLDRRAGAIAAGLTDLAGLQGDALGPETRLGPEVRVGVLLDRSGAGAPDLVAALLGTLRAGGAYVPLDPAYPEERVRFMLEDSGARLLVTRRAVLERSGLESSLPEGLRVLLLDDLADLAGGDPPPPAPADPGRLAYVIYTSGSTGRPKGVAIEHRSAAALVAWARRVFRPEELAGTLASTSICFDLSVFEIFVPLALGGRVVLAADALELPRLAAAMPAGEEGDGITLVNTVPSAIAELLEAGGVPASVRTVNLAGEPLKGSLVRRLYALGTVERVLNLYGPSEDTTYSTWEVIPRDEEREPTIGRAVGGGRLYLLDPAGCPVPPGVPGEVHLGGRGVARGYLARPALTAERFVPDPIPPLAPRSPSHPRGGKGTPPPDPLRHAGGARLYRTGDLARHLPDGRVEFLGRIDQQVKLRGFRIELGEVEAALEAHDGVGAAVAVVRERGSSARLVAYVVPAEGADAPGPEALAAHLRERLPGFMVPGHFVPLAGLPLTPNGKVDRRALPEPDWGDLGREGSGGRPPEGETEEAVAAIWREALGLADDGAPVPLPAEGSFFRLGGHSLLAVRVVARVRERLGVELPLRALFEAPTIAGLAAAVDRARGAGDGARQPAEAAPRWSPGEPAPLSFAQERLWFLDRLEPGRAVYNVPFALELTGDLDAPALAGALAGVAERQVALRTRFAEEEGAPVQRVEDGATLSLPRVDLGGLPEPAREAEALSLRRAEARRPFDLSVAPLARATLLRLGHPPGRPDGQEHHHLLVTLHHTVADGWSLAVLADELAALYTARVTGRPAELPELAVSPPELAVRERAREASADVDRSLDEDLAFWRRRLEGVAPLPLPTDHPRPRDGSGRGTRVPLALDPELTARLEALAREEGATLFAVLLAGVAALLHRHAGTRDVALGAPVAGRGAPGSEPLVGLFVNTLVLRLEVAPERTFRRLLADARDTALEALAHQELPFERLVRELAPGRELGRTPLFQVVLAFQNAPLDPPELPGLAARELPTDSGTAKFDLTFDLREAADGGLAGWIELDLDLFEPATAERWAGHLGNLLAAAAAAPETPVADLPTMGEAERRRVLREWSGLERFEGTAGGEAPGDASVPELFARHAAERPDAVALLQDGAWGDDAGTLAVTYGELDRRSAALARRLVAAGAGRGAIVGVLLERSPEMVTALLAVLRAGGAYLPLDPALPAPRLEAMLDDAGAGTRSGAPVVTSARFRDRLPTGGGEGEGRPVVLLDAEEARDPAGVPGLPEPGPGDLAYVVFTSGSTGRPKGVAVAHRSVARLVRGAGYVSLSPDETLLQLATVSFDASTLELWGALCRGGRLVVAPPEPPSLEELADLLDRQRVSTLWLTAGLFHQMVEARPAALARVRQLLAGGDALSPEHVRRALADRRGPTGGDGAVLVNGYGPTENTTFTCCRVLTPADLARPSVPVGRPIAGTTVYLVDPGLRPVAAGVVGELVTGGDGVALGYLSSPERTAEVFVPDPFRREPGARLYRTGDLARFLPDGRIELLGRADRQVKLRGFRVEPGEIEAALVAHPEVAEAVVVVREGPSGDRRLVGYFVAREGRAPEPPELAEALAEHLTSRLPSYMVPADLVPMDTLPLTPQGKIDRAALPDPERGGDAGGRPPRGPVECAIAQVFSELLGAESIGADDSFFDLGGHSLLATRVATRLGDRLGVRVALRDLFDSPTVAGLAAVLSDRSARRPGAVSVPVAGEGDGVAPLSFSQERVWFFERLHPGSAVYNVPLAAELAGPLDPAALAAALSGIVARHRVLRARFTEEDGEPRQSAAPPAPDRASPLLPVVDLSGLPERIAAGSAGALRSEEARRPFDLVRDLTRHPPLLRARLLRLEPGRHQLLVTVHHAATDGWSLGVLVRELSALYRAAVAGRPVAEALPEPPIQYADYAAWQRRRLGGRALDAGIDHWRERLSGLRPLELPTDRPRPPARRFRGGRVPLTLPPELVDRLEDLARRSRVGGGGDGGATLFMVLVAGLAALLHRWTGATDLAVGTPVAGRERPETEGLIGFFVNTLVLRAEVEPGLPFAGLLERVHRRTVEAFEHREVPFEKLVEHLAPDLAHTPLFQVALALQNAPLGGLDLPGVEAEVLPAFSGTAKFDLTLELLPDGEGGRGGLAGWVEHDRDLFDPTTARRLARHLETLLAGAAEAPETPVAALPLLGRGERHQVVREWKGRLPELPERPVHELVAARAEEAPDAIAVVAPGTAALSYRELARRSRRLAERLAGAGVGRGDLVAVAVPRTPERVVALLGVLGAGAAYLSLDPDHPRARLELMLADAGDAPALVTTSALAPELPDPGGPVLLLDREATDEERGGGPAPRIASRAGLDDRAYVVYTSGSTGRPKGVEIPHRGIVRLVARADYTHLAPDESFLHLAPLAFDASTLEIWGPLATGGRLVLQPPGPISPEGLARVLAGERLTNLFLTTALFRALADDPGTLAPLRHLMTGGEAASPEAMRRALRRLPGFRLSNVYGPTENTTFTSHHPMTAPEEVADRVPLGRPIAGSTCHVVDPSLRPVPAGVAGELLNGGDGLARGYFRRPRETAERFVPDPFAAASDPDARPGARLYRTGDLARHLPGGRLEFLGRIDFQVKLRGFRIELGEVQAALTEHPGIAEAVAAVRSAPAGDRRLVAWVVPRPEAPADTSADWDAFLRERLPEFMCPGHYVSLPALPLTANGKVDRRALPDPPWGSLARGGRPPRSPVEQEVARVFASVLGCGAVGIDESFFDLGGHSLLATRVVSRLRRVLGVDVPLRALFEDPTVAGLSERVEAELAAAEGEGEEALPPILPEPRSPGEALPLSFSQERLWFLDRLDPGSPLYSIPFSLDLAGDLDPAVLARTLEDVVARHESLRTRFVDDPERPGQVVEESVELPLPVVDLSGLATRGREAAGAEVARLRRAHAETPFDLGRAPLLAALLVRRAPERHELLIALHHAVADGWSLGVLVEEVAAIHDARRSGSAPALPPLPVQYPDFALWQRRHLRGEALERRLAYWRRKLAGVRPLDLPTDRPRAAARSLAGALRWFELPPELSDGLRALARDRASSLFMVLLAGLVALLHRYTGADDLTVGTPIAGRDRAEIEPLIGFFVNTLVLRAGASPERPFDDLLAEVRSSALEAYARQDTPFERLVDEVAPRRDLTGTPLFQVLFVLQNADVRPPRLAGLEVTPIPLGSGTSKFDLTLALEESGEPEGAGDGRLKGSLEYATALFDATTTGRLLEHYRELLASAVAAPGTPLARLTLLRPAERHQLLLETHDVTAGEAPSGRARAGETEAPVHRRIAAMAAERPDAVAVVAGGRCLTYGALVGRARRLAAELTTRTGRHLRAAGADPETPVGVKAERSPEAVVAILAAMEAGAPFVPLDPAYPPDRLALMLEDSGAALAIADGPLPVPADLPRVAPSAGTGGSGRDGDGEPHPEAGPDLHPERAAYVVYTSGSTGRPKGIVGVHGALAVATRALEAAFGLSAGERLLMMPSLSFDASLGDLFPTLAAGGVLHLPPAAEMTPAELTALCQRERIDVVDIPAAFWRQWLEELPAPGQAPGQEPVLPDLRRVVVGGESVAFESLARWRERTGGRVRFIGAYGPTETTICATTRATVDGSEHRGRAARLPLGLPIAGVRVHVLDAGLSPVPMGVPGELAIGGPGVTRGYRGRPGATAGAFLPDPFFEAPGARMYRTGDLARRLGDGTLEFLGRIDHQVKVRGYRIEPAEIEAALRVQPGVAQAVVAVREEASGARRLVGWVAPGAGEGPGEDKPPLSPDALRAALEERLPGYMVPSALVVLDALPVTPTGKVDRAALPAPEELRPEAPRVAPRSPVERALAEIWAGVLGVEPAGVHDNFFDLGGDSILSLRIVARARAAGLPMETRDPFRHQTVAELAAAFEGRAAHAPDPGVALDPPMDPEGPLPLSPLQRGMLFDSLAAPGTGVYVNQVRATLRGRLDADALRRAWEALHKRHPILRTAFRWRDVDEPEQEAAPEVELPWRQEDRRAEDPRDADARLRRELDRERRAGFALDRAPLSRITLVRLTDDCWRFAWTHHHLIVDGWSVALVLRDLFALYGAFRGYPSEEEPPEASGGEGAGAAFAAYLGRLRRSDLEAAEAFWRRELAGLAGPTSLAASAEGADRAVRPDEGPAPAPDRRRALHLPAPVTAGLGDLARRHRLTLNSVVAGAWALVLGRHARSDGDEVVFGVTVSGRPAGLPGVESAVGPFINTVPLRVPIPGGEPAVAWLTRLQERQVEMREHEHAPLARIQAWSGLPRGAPPFEVLFAFENHPVQALEALSREGVEVADVEAAGANSVPFTLSAAPGERLRLEATYDAGRLEATRVERLLRRLSDLLTAMSEEAASLGERTVGELAARAATTPAERHQALSEWNDTAGDLPGAGERLETLIRRQAERTPEAVAVTFEGEALSYRELLARSGRLAARLRGLPGGGVGPESRVAVCLERSTDLVVALLAVLEAGGAYVPLDPDYPAERLAYLAEDSRARAVIGRREHLAALPLPDGAAQVVMDDPGGSSREAREAPATGPVSADALAYVIYTSGSTGRPKGAMNAHRGVVNRILWMQSAYGLGPGDRVAQKTPYSFDVSVWELFWPLVTGATLVVARPGGHRDAAYLARLFARERVTTVHFVPSMLQPFVDEPGFAACSSLRRVIASGEALPAGLVRRFFERAPQAADGGPDQAENGGPELHNLYGPTEAAVDVTAWRCLPGDPGPVPIGRPITNLTTHVLDPTPGRGLDPVARGVAGELFLGGVGVGRGYLDRPALTAERFLPDPFSPAPGGRLYRTGDLVRHRPDGALEYLGRLDFQVKVRGVRIELGEIEAALAAHPGVREAVVLASPGPSGSRLVAFVVAGTGAPPPEASELRAFLTGRLPEAMVPARFVALDTLPLSPAGKADRRALAELDADAGRPDERERTAPRTATEERLAAIWRAALDLPEVGVHERFLDLGGDSLVALRMLAAIRRELGRELSLPELLAAPTVAELAGVIEAGGAAAPLLRGAVRTPEELAPECVLPDDVRPEPRPGAGPPTEGPPTEVFLTGATGFLGAFLLAELLNRPTLRVHCLVRAADPEAAFARLRESLARYGLWEGVADRADRIRAIPGDLAAPRLGLDPDTFRELAGSVDRVIHNGALVHFGHPYEVLRRPNVEGTAEVLRLAAAVRPVPVHHVSTADVFAASGAAARGPVPEDLPLAEAGRLPGGYLQSKWVAECLVAEAGRRGLPVTVHRPGRVAWHSATGAWAEGDALHRVLRACRAAGSAPALARPVDVTPVDHAAAAIVRIALDGETGEGRWAGPFHVVNPRPVPWDELIGHLRAAGCPLRTVSFDDWRREVAASPEASEALAPLLALSTGEIDPAALASGAVYDCRRTLAALEGSGIRCPEVSETLARPLVEAWRRRARSVAAGSDEDPVEPERRERYAERR